MMLVVLYSPTLRSLFVVVMILRPPSPTLFPYTTLFRSLTFDPAITGGNFVLRYGANVAGVTGLTATVPWSGTPATMADRKSTRLNSSHVEISYAVFCLKKKSYITLQ